MLLFVLEIEHIPGARFLDARTYADRFANDSDPIFASGPESHDRPRRPWRGTSRTPGPTNA